MSGKKILEIINEYETLYGIPPTVNRVQLLQHAVLVYRELNLSAMPTGIEVGYWKIVEPGVIHVPPNFDHYIKVGVYIGGNLWTLTTKEDMHPPGLERECGITYENAKVATQDTLKSVGHAMYSPHHDSSGRFVGRMYSLGGGWNSKGYVKYDETNRRLIFEGVNAKSVVVEYKTHGVSKSTVVPNYAINSIITYLRWQMELETTNANMNRILHFEGQHAAAIENMVLNVNPFRVEDYLDTFYKEVHQGVNR